MQVTQTPLAGVRVLDLSRVLAGPWCAQLLGDLGADVVKVEMPGRGDDARELGVAMSDTAPQQPGNGRDSSFFLACNRNKRSIAIDFSTPAGAEQVRALVRECDVLVENFKAGGLARYGLDWATLRELNPRLIYCSVTGFGHDGPYASRPAYDFVMQAMTGMMSTCGQPDGAPGAMPMRTAIPSTDLTTGYQAAIGVLAALLQRGNTGRGQFIDAAMLDASVGFNVHLAQGFLLNGKVPTRQGNNNPIASPSGVFRTADGWVVAAAGNDRQFAALCKVLARPDLVTHPLFCSNADRVTARAALHAEIEPLFAEHATAHWLPLLEAAQVPSARINTMQDVFDDPQVQHRRLTVEVEHGSGQRIPILRSTLNLSDSSVEYRAPPQLGQHTDEVLDEWLGAESEAADKLFGLPMPMAAAFGLRGTHIGNDRAEVRMPYRAAFTNSRAQVHGGALAVLLDCTLASAARSHNPQGFGVVTVDLSTHYVAPGEGEVIGTAVCERRGKSLCFVRGEARSTDGTLLALATGTFKLVARPTPT